ncbi:matrixin family metalloprotease [Azospirillum sp.]|uniref:matrixin family metalloprotease n=1 Tax=Azospirillum sp. TaxID=34012 RepID=UPI002D39504F|nr:matrixin family metalloprotease [Azospirillum sp.]HYD71382.1 matrixin family metalloprotease [Azospirillum sp.]
MPATTFDAFRPLARAVVGVVDDIEDGVVGTVRGVIGDDGTDHDVDPTPTPEGVNSGDAEVDALLVGDPYRWNADSMFGMPVTVTYSFMARAPSYYQPTEVIAFQAFNDAMKEAARAALAEWSAAANITFVEVADTGAGGTIRFGAAELDERVAAYAFIPLADDPRGGDVWVTTFDPGNLAPGFGSYAYLTYVHEIGHAIGLKHPGNYNATGGGSPGPFLPASLDNTDQTVMSYITGNIRYPVDLGPLDVDAVAYLYGPKTARTIGHMQAGDDRADRLLGDANDNSLIGNGGDDTLSAGTGDDGLLAGPGNDRADGGEGDDRLYGNQGMDDLAGGAGDDTLHGGQDADVVGGGAGADLMYGNLGDDTLFGGQGTDRLFGGQGADVIDGGDGNDTLYGNAGADTLHGGGGADAFYVGVGRDVVTDFRHGTDRIHVARDAGITTAADVLARVADGAGGAVIDLNAGNSVTLVGVSRAGLSAMDFLVV